MYKLLSGKNVGWVIGILSIIIGIILMIQLMPGYINPGIDIEWSTGSELNTIGFNVLRSSSKDGNYIKLNSNLIPAASDPLAGNNYSYTDNDIERNKRYYYILEAVEGDGSVEHHGPIEAEGNSSSLIVVILSSAPIVMGLFILINQLKLVLSSKRE